VGGYGSGRRREVNRGTVESYRWIDIDALTRTDSLWSRWPKVVKWEVGGRPAGEIAIRAECDHVVLSYRIGPDARSIEDAIAVTDIACHFGLGRPYFVCPGLDLNHPCGRLVKRLYLVDQLFRCGHCYRLTYASCNETSCGSARSTGCGRRPSLLNGRPSRRWWTNTGLSGSALGAEGLHHDTRKIFRNHQAI
jgi:hypothetical protein